MSALNSKHSFFRQSTWMVIATLVGGLCMLLVHTVTARMGKQEYSSFGAMLRLMIIMGIPGSALQTIFARQAAAATTAEEEEQLRATTRVLLGCTFLTGMVTSTILFTSAHPIARLLKVSNPVAIYFSAFLALTGMWVPIGRGLLQGKHNFGGLGWLQIIEGVVRFSIVLVAVMAMAGKAVSAMFAVMVGQLITVGLTAWMTRSIWRTRATVSFRWKPWFAAAVPLTLGSGTVLAMQGIDTLFVQGLFPDAAQTALYIAAMLTGFSIIQFIAPVALVMFARIAKNAARSERSDSLRLTLTATLLFGVAAAIGCTILPKLPLQVIYFSKRAMWDAAPLVPWYAWALVPLTAANVLVQNLLARGQFKAVPWLIMVPVLYAAALCGQAHALIDMKPFDAFIRVIQTLGGASLLLCAVAAWFCRSVPPSAVPGRDLAAARVTSCKASSPPV